MPDREGEVDRHNAHQDVHPEFAGLENGDSDVADKEGPLRDEQHKGPKIQLKGRGSHGLVVQASKGAQPSLPRRKIASCFRRNESLGYH